MPIMLTGDVGTFLPIFAKSLMEDKDEPILQHEGNRLAICYLMIARRTEEYWAIAVSLQDGNPTFTLTPIESDTGRTLKLSDSTHWTGIVKTDLTSAGFFSEAIRIIDRHMEKLLNAK